MSNERDLEARIRYMPVYLLRMEYWIFVLSESGLLAERLSEGFVKSLLRRLLFPSTSCITPVS